MARSIARSIDARRRETVSISSIVRRPRSERLVPDAQTCRAADTLDLFRAQKSRNAACGEAGQFQHQGIEILLTAHGGD